MGGGEDVVYAELDTLVWPFPQGSGGVGRWLAAKRRGSLGVGGLWRPLGPLGTALTRPSRPFALGAAPPAPAPVVAILEEVEQGLAAAGERPVAALAFLVALGPRHLCERQGLSGAGCRCALQHLGSLGTLGVALLTQQVEETQSKNQLSSSCRCKSRPPPAP